MKRPPRRIDSYIHTLSPVSVAVLTVQVPLASVWQIVMVSGMREEIRRLQTQLGITTLYADRNTPSDGLRYGRQRLDGIRARDVVTTTPDTAPTSRLSSSKELSGWLRKPARC